MKGSLYIPQLLIYPANISVGAIWIEQDDNNSENLKPSICLVLLTLFLYI
jgi:hypothetical protein